MYYIIIVAVVALDQIVKYLTAANMEVGESLPVIGQIFSLTYIHNTGAAFSIFEGKTWFLILVPVVVTVVLLAYIIVKRKKEHPALLAALSLIISGGVGNVIDRIRLGYVIDMFDFQVWPIFNVADIAVCTGCGFLILYLLVLEPRAAKRMERSQEHGI